MWPQAFGPSRMSSICLTTENHAMSDILILGQVTSCEAYGCYKLSGLSSLCLLYSHATLAMRPARQFAVAHMWLAHRTKETVRKWSCLEKHSLFTRTCFHR